MENLRQNQRLDEINLLTKQAANWRREYGELVITSKSMESKLTALTNERDDLRRQLTAANETSVLMKQQHEDQIRGFETQIKMLKKQNSQLSSEVGELEAKKAKCEEELKEVKMKVAKLEEEKGEIVMKEKEEVSRVSKKNEKLSMKLSAVVDVASDKYRGLEKRLATVEQDVINLSRNFIPQGSQLVDTPQVMQEHQESFGPETNTDGTPRAQSGPEMTPIGEKTASSMPGPKGVAATCVKGQPQSFESGEKSISSMPCNRKTSSAALIDLSSSDDEGKPPSSKGLKRKLHSSDASYKTGDGGSSGKCRLSPDEALNPLKKTVHWDFEADLLDDLQKDTELCMKGICALYRQRLLCTIRETSLAKSLIGGATLADVDIDPDECRKIALAHSRQLFNIYKNGKDPLFAHGAISC